MSPTSTPFSDRLEQELQQAGATQQQLAKHLGVSQQTVSKWVTGETTPRLRHLPVIEAWFELAPGTLSSLLFAPKQMEPALKAGRTPRPSVAALQRKLNSLTSGELTSVDRYIDQIFHNRS